MSGSTLPAYSQKASPTPPIDDEVVKISTTLIQIDVSVTDKDGKPVSDIKPSEIEIYENGKKQTVMNFAFVSSGRPANGNPASAVKNADKIAVPQPVPLVPRPENIRRTVAIVVDDLSMSWESIAYTRGALKKFVEQQVQDGDLVAILRTGGNIGSLQRFTTDKRILLAAIEKIRYNPMGTGATSAMYEIAPSGTETLNTGLGGLPGGLDAEVEGFLDSANTRRNGILVSGTLGALSYVVNGMSDMPGRQSVMLFSDGFELFERDRDGTPRTGLAMLNARKLIEQANRAAVVFYPIDPRGLQPGTLQASDNTRGMSPRSMMAAVDTRRQRMWESQSGINFLAEETGGFAFFNNNDLTKGVSRVLEDQSYYLIGYVPDSDTFDPSGNKYNKLEVKVLRKGANARFRSGFFGVTDTKKIAGPPPDRSANYVAQLRDALLSPFAVNGITLRLNSLFGSGGENDLYVRSLLHIDANGLKFTDEKDGQKKCSFEVLATSFGSDGQLVDQIGKTYTVTVPPDVYNRVLAEGIVYHFKFPARKAGAYQYRVAIRDSVSGNIGAASEFVDVPDVGGGKLTLSSIVVEDMSVGDFQAAFTVGSGVKTDPMRDTSLRRIQVGRVYRYSLEIYNAGLDASKKPNIETRIRVFREGKMILDGPPKPLDTTGQSDMAHLRFLGGLAIGSQMEPGDYVLQIIVTDNFGKKKRQVASQFVQFEVVP
jgi:VWFA-related protein